MGVQTCTNPFSSIASVMSLIIRLLSSKTALTSGLRRSMNLWFRRVSISAFTLSTTPSGSGVPASDSRTKEEGMISTPSSVWLLSLTSPVTLTTDSLGRVVSTAKSSGSTFFFGRVI